jgi:hypothetical protein
MYMLYVNLDMPPVQKGLVRHFFTFALAVCLITFTGALIDTVVFLADDLVVYLAGAVLIACIAVGVSYRYLDMSLTFSLFTGAAFLIMNLVAWFAFDDWFWDKVGDPSMFSVWLILFVLCLILEAAWYHDVPPQPPRPISARGADGGTPTLVRRFIHWFSNNWLLMESFLFSLVLLYMVVHISLYPIFNLYD